MRKPNSKPIKLTGPVLYANVKNANGRIYTTDCILKIMDQAQEHIHRGSLLGELDQPNRPEVSLGQVSHRVTEVYYNFEKNALEATIEVLETPKGQILKSQIESCGNVKNFMENMGCISSRGTGTINEKGEVENYTLYSFDVVAKNKDAYRDITFAPISDKNPLEDLK